MSLELLSVLLFLAQAITTKTSGAELVNDCPPSRCSQSGPEIRLPLSLNSAPPYCRLFSSGLNLSCSDNHTLLLHSPSPSGYSAGSSNESNVVAVAAVDYDQVLIKLSRPWAACPWQTNSTIDVFDDTSFSYCQSPDDYRPLYTLVNCTAELVSSSSIRNESIAGPISCLSGTAGSDPYFVYAVYPYNALDSLPSYCSVVSRGTAGCTYGWSNLTFRQEMEEFSSTVIAWDYDDNNDCTRCSFRGGSCGYNQATNQTFCINSNNHGEHLDPLDTIFNFTHIYHSEAMSHGFHTIRLRHGDTNSISILTCPNVSHSFHVR